MDFAECIAVGENGQFFLGCQKQSGQEAYTAELLEIDTSGGVINRNSISGLSAVEVLLIDHEGNRTALCDADIDVLENVLALVRLDASGDRLWSTSYDELPGSLGRALIETTDRGFLAAGWAGRFPSQQGLLVKFTIDGSIQWSRSYGNEGIACFPDVITHNDSYLVMGNSMSNEQEADVCFLLIDDEGNELRRVQGELAYEASGCALRTTTESIVALCGTSARDHIDPVLLFMNDSLAVEQLVNLGATSLVEFPVDMELCPNGNLAVLVSRFNADQNGAGIYLIELTEQGQVVRQREIRLSAGYLIPADLIVLEDASLCICGYYAPPQSTGENSSAFLLKTDKDWNVLLPE